MFRIYDYFNNLHVFEASIKNESLVGRLKSGLFTYAGGHIYFGNDAIKLRYDLIERENNLKLKENEIFDFYSEVISNVGQGK
jgi:hypothetical protein